MPDARLNVPALFITEKNGQRRELKLTARALPFRPVRFAAIQRVNVEWYAGNPVGTSTVLGSEQEPTTFSGEWNEKFLVGDGRTTPAALNGRPITTTEELVKIVDSFRACGALMEVRWFVETRRGHLKMFERNWFNVNDCAWSMEFVWISDSLVDSGSAVQAPPTVARTTEEAASELDSMVAQLASPPDALEPGVLERISDKLALVQASVSQLRDGVGNAAQQALGPYDATRRALGALVGLAGSSYDVVQEAAAQPSAFVFNTIGRDPGIDFTPGRRIRAAAFVATKLNEPGRALARRAAIAQANLQRAMQSDLLAVYTAREGDDLRDVSLKFYGNAEGWRDLLLFNHLSTAELERGQIVYVPRKSLSDGGALEG